MQDESSNKNAYEARKASREAEKADMRQNAKRAEIKATGARGGKTVGWIALVLIIFGGGIWVVENTREPLGDDYSQFYESQGRTHIDVGEHHPEYSSNPPSSGWHYPSPARTGFYDTPIPDEMLVHNLEHGEIWIAYHPRISDTAKDTLRDFADTYVVVAPRESNDADIALVSWTRVDTFNLEENELHETYQKRIEDFIRRYDNRGPENLRGIQHNRL
ncbi:MAG: hypothetical protein COW88_01395 [Candidatus Lloydbacteria bacterium CG22_combo_CG10-13_8_21_14_all_47_15]|uniref:DUF3105 domain-containing protein n=1 Tax=Candidatus Lloydbacteria bacterium CG22_combo_CG10-13_8_21_14_all_47_15 TaxID=1974635 RepID=A0A2H0CUG6_9BACT|nr:MAG: hypothetical protein COW88_01395 [Candidatus Lloydbacteria bacterium CG22_combo_CG10-13_8_21_14_all_47_15]